jgi:hypothetical protein
MSTKVTAEQLLDQILALPEEAQIEIVQALIGSRAEDAGIFPADEDQQGTLARERS